MWQGNIAHATEGAIVSGQTLQGVAEVNPKLAKVNRLWRLSKSSPAVDAAVGEFPYIKNDIERQKRGIKKDVGADEFSAVKTLNRALTAKDVGPNAK